MKKKSKLLSKKLKKRVEPLDINLLEHNLDLIQGLLFTIHFFDDYQESLVPYKKFIRDRNSIVNYKFFGYTQTNIILRSNIIPEPLSISDFIKDNKKFKKPTMINILKMIKSIDNHMGKNTYPKSKWLYRGIKYYVKPGDELIERGFLSSSSNIKIANRFTNHFAECCIIRFKIPKDIKIYDYTVLEEILNNLKEDEILLERNLVFKIKHSKQSKSLKKLLKDNKMEDVKVYTAEVSKLTGEKLLNIDLSKEIKKEIKPTKEQKKVYFKKKYGKDI